MRYSAKLDADRQVSMEEAVAAYIFSRTETEGCDGCGTLSEEDAADAARTVVLMVLSEFRPDLFEEPDHA